MAEKFDVAGRGAFYEEAGVIRDVIQNHLLQIVSYLAMEAPSPLWTAAVHAEQAKVLRTVRPLSPKEIVLGQYEGYRKEAGVNPDSKVPTYAALHLFVDSWRWQGVPFFVRAGKCLETTRTEVIVELNHPPQVVFKEPAPAHGNYVRFRLLPRTSPSRSAPARNIPASRCRANTWSCPWWSGRNRASPGAWKPTNGCSATRWMAMPRCSRARKRWRPPGPSWSRCFASRNRCTNTPAAAPVRRKPTGWSRKWAAGRRRRNNRDLMTPTLVTGDRPEIERALVSDFQSAASDAMAAHGEFLVALSGGSIAPLFFPALARLPLDWSRVDFFWADERAVPPEHPDSNYGEAMRLWLTPAGVPPGRIHRMHGEDPDLRHAAQAYAAEPWAVLPAILPRWTSRCSAWGRTGTSRRSFRGTPH